MNWYFNFNILKDHKIILRSESDNTKILLETHIAKEEIYRLENGNKKFYIGSLIIWNDLDIDTEIALSFQTIEGSSYIWDKIRIFQGKEPNAKTLIDSI